jgi:hypothetical protein
MVTNGSTAHEPDLAQPTDARMRSGRALIGWMRPEQALALLSGSPDGSRASQEHQERVAHARQAVSSRSQERPDITTSVRTNPPELEAIRQRVLGHPSMQPYVNEGWQIGRVDLSAVRSFQGQIVTEHAADRVGDPDPGDRDQLASITLPIVEQYELPVALDGQGKAWIIVSADHNLGIRSHYFGQPIPGAPPVLGFHVAPQTSLLLVVEYNGALYLRDGYHRSFGLLSRGITDVPALVLEGASYDDLRMPQGMLPHDAFLGDHPPYLPDFLDDDVAADVSIPASDKLVMVQAVEVGVGQVR